MVLSIGVIYSLPNLYPAKPAIQIAYTDSGKSADQILLNQVKDILEDQSTGVESVGLKDNNIIAKFNSFDDQLAGKAALQKILLDEAIIALNLEPSTPQWLRNIGAGPLKLGLDLSGGVHFLLEVDIDSALDNRLESLLNEYRKKFRDDRINVESSRKDNKDLTFSFPSDEDYNKALRIFSEDNITPLGTPLFDLRPSSVRNLVELAYSQSAIKEIRDYAVGQNLMTLRNRVNELGVSEPIVQRQGSSRIVVQLPGVQDTTAAKKIIGKTANLEFRLEAASTTSRLRKEEFDWQDERMGSAFLEKNIIVAGERVTNASSGFDESGFAQVNITLDMQGGRAMQKATNGNIGRRLGVLFVEQKNKSVLAKDADGNDVIEQTSYIEKEIISLATVQAVLGTAFRITGVGSPQEASELALLLRAGALAAPMKFVEERTVGPSLGKENIELGVRSIIIGLLSVIAFMLFYYRWFGFAANIALFANVILITGFMSLLGATLTLPGIAGIVLTIGMAVDANVLIFERIKEECKKEKNNIIAFDTGYVKSKTAIIDANITTLIAAVILFFMGSGPVKGFSVTLAVGIFTTLFSVYFIARMLTGLYVVRNKEKTKLI